MKPAPDGASGAAEIFGVRRLSQYVSKKLESDPALRALAVRGEVFDVKSARGGYFHFALKEGDDVLSCFAWEQDARTFPELRQGMQVVAFGALRTYARRSTYQLIVSRVRAEGIGDAHALFEEIKRKLAAEGLFDSTRKRPLPRYPFRVALVSSKGAAGAGDFVTLLRRERPHVKIMWCETSVQGANAVPEIVGAIGYASRLDVDAIVVTRGGGSFEDLFVFSDERVVRAVVAAKHPVLCAIGHSVDQQLADYAADAHAETPSDAVGRMGPETRELRRGLADSVRRARDAALRTIERGRDRLESALRRSRLEDARAFLAPSAQRLGDAQESLDDAVAARFGAALKRLEVLRVRLAEQDPRVRLERRASRLREATARLGAAIRTRLERAGAQTSLRGARLSGNDPEAILQRGYAIVTHANRIVRDPRDVPIGSAIRARVARGTFSARVETEREDGNERSG